MGKIKQSFTFRWKDKRVFGCSFKLAPNGQYFGWVTEYRNKEEYCHPHEWRDYKNIPLKTILANKFLVLLTNLLYHSNLTDMETAYKVFERNVIESMNLRCVEFDFEPEITAKVLKRGFKCHETRERYNYAQ